MSRSSCPEPPCRQFSSSTPSSSPSSTPSTTPSISTSMSRGGLLYIRDTLSSRFFLINTGCRHTPRLQLFSLRCPSTTKKFSPSFPRSLVLVSLPGQLNTMYTIIWRRRDRPSRPQHAVWTPRSTPLLRPSSNGWRRLALSGGAIRHGHPPYTWCRNRTVLGAPVGIFDC